MFCLSLTRISQFPTVLRQQAFIKGLNFIRQPTEQSNVTFKPQTSVPHVTLPCPLCATEGPLILAYSNSPPKTSSPAPPTSKLEQVPPTPSQNQLGTAHTHTVAFCPPRSVLSSCSFPSQQNLQFPLDFLSILWPPGFCPISR